VEDNARVSLERVKKIIDNWEGLLTPRLSAVEIGSPSKHIFNAMSQVESLNWRSYDLCNTSFRLLQDGHYIPSVVLLRSAIETSSVLHALLSKVTSCISSGCVDDFESYIVSMLCGGRTGCAELPVSTNVLTFIDKVDASHPGFRRNYDFLSNMAHPNGGGVSGAYSKMLPEEFTCVFGTDIHDDIYRYALICLEATALFHCTCYASCLSQVGPFIQLCNASAQA